MDYSIHDAKEVFVKLYDFLAEDFKDFLSDVQEGDLKSEYLLPNIADKRLKEERANVMSGFGR